MSTSSQSVSPLVRSPSQEFPVSPPNHAQRLLHTGLSPPSCSVLSSEQDAAAPRRTSPGLATRALPHQPSSYAAPPSARRRGTRRSPAARRSSQGRACPMLGSGCRSGARATRSHTRTEARWSGPGPWAPRRAAELGGWARRARGSDLPAASCLCLRLAAS